MIDSKQIRNKLYEFRYLVVSLVVWALIYHQTLLSMVKIWWNSETFTHGFLIFPIVAYLIYQKRSLFYQVERKKSLVAFILLLLVSLFWGIASLVDILVLQQLAVVAMLPLIVAALYGYKVVLKYLFPFVYLFFAVPIGDFLIPKLQYITAEITVLGLQLTGIPVYHEGMFISVPAGDFEVAVACSGIRYLIASMALGTLYAYLMYQSYLKRTLFMLASVIVPIIANGIRAYGIVLIANLSDMKYATGVDHLIYGWFFFGLVMFILFYIGGFWEDKQEHKEAADKPLTFKNQAGNSLLSIIVLGLVLMMGPLYYTYSIQNRTIENVNLILPELEKDWQKINMDSVNWKPNFINNDQESMSVYQQKSQSAQVYFYSTQYLNEAQGKELANSMNTLFDTSKWIVINHEVRAINNHPVIEYQVTNNSQKLLIWGWYVINDNKVASLLKVKWLQMLNNIKGKSSGGHFVAIATPLLDFPVEERDLLKLFYQQNLNKQFSKGEQ